jgi:hypothetical protein
VKWLKARIKFLNSGMIDIKGKHMNKKLMRVIILVVCLGLIIFLYVDHQSRFTKAPPYVESMTSGEGYPRVDLVSELGLQNSTAVRIYAVRDKKLVAQLHADDIPLLLASLRDIPRQSNTFDKATGNSKFVGHCCLGDFDIVFYGGDAERKINLGHKNVLSAGGLAYAGRDFVMVMEKYLPNYFPKKNRSQQSNK